MKTNVILALLFLGACSSLEPIQTRTIIESPNVIHPSDPLPVDLRDFNVIVVNRNELEKLLNRPGDAVYFMLTPDGYEDVVKNFNELRRYIENQKQIILYYRKVLETPEAPLK